MMKHLVNAAFIAALVGCTVDTRDRERFESSRGAPAPSDELTPDAGSDGAASEPECVLHSDCDDGLACVDGTCSAIATDGSVDATAPDANESESESEAEAEAEAESESESEAEADAALPSADGASVPDGGSSTDGGAPSADATVAAPDAGTPDPDAALPPEPVTIVIEVPEGQTVDTTAICCATLGGGWACAPFALGGTSGREIRATFEDPASTAHVFNACLRNCDDPFNGVWMAYQSSGLRQLADPVVTRGDTVVPESLTDNGVGGANWLVDLSPPE